MKRVLTGATDFAAADDIYGMTKIENDSELLRRSLAAPAEFGVLYERHGVRVRRYVVSRVGAVHGEDLAAEVFIRAFRSREKCRAVGGSALPWLLGVANHVIGDHRRLERRRLAALARIPPERATEADGRSEDLDPELINALKRLSPADRDTLLLLVWGELSRDETAAALGVPVGTVNSRIARARRHLASDLAPQQRTALTNCEVNGEANG